jgi:hypothetical protein
MCHLFFGVRCAQSIVDKSDTFWCIASKENNFLIATSLNAEIYLLSTC